MSEEKYPEIVMPQCQAAKVLKGQKALVTGGSSGIGAMINERPGVPANSGARPEWFSPLSQRLT